MEVRARAPGKIILSGEHAVVHGYTAIATSINLFTYTTICFPPLSESDDVLKLHLKDIDLELLFPIEKIRNVLPRSLSPCSSNPKQCPHDTVKIIAALVEKLNIPEERIGLASGVSAFLWLYTSIQGCKPATVVITSELPLAAGLGSSASFCVSLAAALLALTVPISLGIGSQGWISPGSDDLDLINKWAFEGEKIIHGNPSGIDNTVSTYGNAIKFKSGCLTRIQPGLSLKMLVTNTKVGRNTNVLVAGVAERALRYPGIMKFVFEAVDSICNKLVEIIQSSPKELDTITGQEEMIEDMMEMNQGLLQCMGVSHAAIESVLQKTQKYELASKLTGAGGGGCVLTLLPTFLTDSDPIVDKVIAELESCGFECFRVGVGGKGVEISSEGSLDS